MLNFSPSYVSSSSTLTCLTCLVCALSASLRSEVHGHTNITHCQEETSNKTIATPHSLNLTFSLFQSPKSNSSATEAVCASWIRVESFPEMVLYYKPCLIVNY